MTWDDAFGLSNTLALAGWLILLLAPRRDWVLAITGLAIPLALALPYTLLMMQHLAAAGGGFGSIAAVRTLFGSDPVLLAGWQHYLAYDLFVGTWIARRLDAADVARVLQWPVLALCFLLGPVGFLVGLALAGGVQALRALRRRTATLPAPILAEVA
jgi:hypothetical protein